MTQTNDGQFTVLHVMFTNGHAQAHAGDREYAGTHRRQC